MFKVILLTCTLLLTSCTERTVEYLNKNSTVIALGDSLTLGYGGDGVTYPKELQDITGLKVVNEGVNGDTSAKLLNRLDSVMEQNKGPISLVILSIGGNDMLHGVSDDEIISNINQIIKYFQSKHIEVVLMAEPRPSKLGVITGFNDANFYKTVAQNNNIFLIDNVFSKFLSKEELKSDLIHLNGKGYVKVAREVAERMNKMGYIIF